MLRIVLLGIFASTVYSASAETENGDKFSDLSPNPHAVHKLRYGEDAAMMNPLRIIVPHYKEALQNYTQTVKLIQTDVLSNKHNISKHENIQIVLGVLDGLISALSARVGPNYDMVFQSLAPRLFNAAVHNSKLVEERLECVFKDVGKQTGIFRDAINNNPHLHEACKKAPQLCNRIIKILVDTADNQEEMSKESNIVIALGEASGMYSDYHTELYNSSVGKDIWQVYTFLVKSKDYLRPLVEAGTRVRKLLNKDNCTAYSLPTNQYPPMLQKF